MVGGDLPPNTIQKKKECFKHLFFLLSIQFYLLECLGNQLEYFSGPLLYGDSCSGGFWISYLQRDFDSILLIYLVC